MENQEFFVKYNGKTRECFVFPSDQGWDEDEIGKVSERVNPLRESIFDVFIWANSEEEAERLGMSLIKKRISRERDD